MSAGHDGQSHHGIEEALSARTPSRTTTKSPVKHRADVRHPSGAFTFHSGNSLEAYANWDTPDTIISDGAYGVRGFRGDTVDASGLEDWYRPHVQAWSKHVKPATSLWFWNTEVGWATVHPLLLAHGWEYVELITWDKGLSHIAGNVNGLTIRQMPVVTEVSALYRRRIELPAADGRTLPVKEWLRTEWLRSGLPLNRSNEACGVKNAATRKYLTQDWLWYWPPGSMVELMAKYTRHHGQITSRPYFSLDGETPVTAESWDALRATWNHAHGLTNVWQRPPLHDSERLKGAMERSAPRTYKPTRASATHLNQKPLEFMVRQVEATTSQGDVVWEPFGGLASASVAAVSTGRRAFAAEVDIAFQGLACERLNEAAEVFAASESDHVNRSEVS
ncbi:DNA methyltransferase [Arthrobacter sp. TmT3-37]